MDSFQARRIIESLRQGIPPIGYVRHFTVGRQHEIDQLTEQLSRTDGTALLLLANYGSGKTHLLNYIRETALDLDYAVSRVVLDASSAVRFNRMDQIFGAICRNIEVPVAPGRMGIRGFFDFIRTTIDEHRDSGYWRNLSNSDRWDFSETLESSALFVALRAYLTGMARTQDLVEDWLYQPWIYKKQRKILHEELVSGLRAYFRDPRPDYQFYMDGVFVFDVQNYSQSWAALRDLDSLAKAAGLNGLIILFDEFEDVINNIRNVRHQESAFWNLFLFYSGRQYPGKTFYAVTPDFVTKCKYRLLVKERYDFDYSRFDALPKFEMSPLDESQLLELARKIIPVHEEAYGWEVEITDTYDVLGNLLAAATQVQVQDRTRYAIRSTVSQLDLLLQDTL